MGFRHVRSPFWDDCALPVHEIGGTSRVHADGTLDTTFDPKANAALNSVVVQADGKILLGGIFTTLQPNGAVSATGRFCFARVNADGTLDTAFDPKPNGGVNSVAVQTDGKVVLAGQFTSLQPNGAASTTARQRIARVNANGTLDTIFDPRANNNVYGVAVQADGKVALGGSFTTLNPNGAGTFARSRIARVNADGTMDTGFDPKANDSVFGVAVQADGKVVLAGLFTTLQPNGAAAATARQRIARVHADGTLDTTFDPKANNWVNSVAVQANGKVLLGGAFTTLQPNGAATATTRNYFARLYNDPATQTLSAPTTTQILWQRGGAAPELSRVTFELSTDGGTIWTLLGAGTRIGTTANWQRFGPPLPASGRLRARGVAHGGYLNGTSGLIEQATGFTFGSPDADFDGLLDTWELTYWATIATQTASDDSDFDGFTNLQERTFGLNPTLRDIPAAVVEDGYLTMTITPQPGVTYEVQSAGTLLTGQPDSFSPATTTVLVNDSTTLKVRDNVLVGTPPARFMRVKLTNAP